MYRFLQFMFIVSRFYSIVAVDLSAIVVVGFISGYVEVVIFLDMI